MVTIASISSGGYLITMSNGRTIYCASFDDLTDQLKTIYGISN